MYMSIVRWLHVSDFHLNKYGVDSQRMRKKLPEYLRELGLKCDYVFFTGDLRYAPEHKFAPETALYLKDLCGAVGNTIDRLFIVLGNHDVDRDISLRNEAIDELIGYYKPKEGILKKEDIAGEIGDILTGKAIGRESEEQITVFDATGTALLDLLTGMLALQEAETKKIGQCIEL